MIHVQPKTLTDYPSHSSHGPVNAPMPTTSEEEIIPKKEVKKSCWSDCLKKKKHHKTLTRYENDHIIANIANETIQ